MIHVRTQKGQKMATKKPRLSITLNKHHHEVLTTISECSGETMSSLIGDLIDASLPTLEKMANALQKIKTATDEQKKQIRKAMNEAQSALEPIAQQALDQLDIFVDSVDKAK